MKKFLLIFSLVLISPTIAWGKKSLAEQAQEKAKRALQNAQKALAQAKENPKGTLAQAKRDAEQALKDAEQALAEEKEKIEKALKHKTVVENSTKRLIEVELVYGLGCKTPTKLQIQPGKKIVHHQGLCCLKKINFVARSGPGSGTIFTGEPQPTRTLPKKSCKDNHYIIREIPEDNSLYLEDKSSKGTDGFNLFLENKTGRKIKVRLIYNQNECPTEERPVNKKSSWAYNTGRIRAGYYTGQISPFNTRCCITKIMARLVEGEGRNKNGEYPWFEYIPKPISPLHMGACRTVRVQVNKNPDHSLFIQETK